MKKIIILLIILLSVISLYSCNTISSDGSITYNGIKYNSIIDTSGYYNFIGQSHKVGTFVSKMGYRNELYCLDSDIEENVMFRLDAFGIRDIWVKEGYEFPNEETIVDFIVIKNMNNNKEKTIEIENCNFNDLFIETDEVNFFTMSRFSTLTITFKYGETIEYTTEGHQMYDYLYSYIDDMTNGKQYVFKLADEYQEEFKSYIAELKAEDNVEE